MFKWLIPKNVNFLKRKKPFDPRERLTLREIQVADMLAEGLSARLISSSMGIAPKATKRYIQSIRRKLWIQGELSETLWEMGFGTTKYFWGPKVKPPRK